MRKYYSLIFFTTIAYAETIQNEHDELLLSSLKEEFILITGIANPKPLLQHLNDQGLSYSHLKFPDHHDFSESELKTIKQKAGNKRMLTTEKDFMRLQGSLDNLYYLPIKVQFLGEEDAFKAEVKAFLKR